MKRSFFISLLFAITGSIFLSAQNVIRSEMLGRPENTSISVKAIFDSVVEVRVSYGTTSGVYPYHTLWQTVNTDSTGEAVAVINITNLSPDTKYFYKMQYRKPGTSTTISRMEHSFQTARGPGESFSFVIEADPHLDAASDTALYRLCLKNQLEDNPDFMIDMGDFLMTDKLKNSSNLVPEDTVPYRCKLLRSFYESVNHSVPLFNVLGNHEGESGWYNNGTAANIAVWDTKYRKKYFMNPIPDGFYSGDTTHYNYIGQREANYAWTWGDALFVVLDPYWFTSPKPDSLHCWRWTLGIQQYDWLKATLENSPSKFKFVFIHNLLGGNSEGRGGIEKAPFYEWGGRNIDSTDGWESNRSGWYKPIKDLLTENRVTILFHGHDHFYGKQELDCLLYQEIPQPSLPNFTNMPQAAEYGYVNGILKPNSGHLRVTVDAAGVTVDYIRVVLPSQETSSLHNKDIAETYHIGLVNCYDSIQMGVQDLPGRYNIITVYPNPVSSNSLVIESNSPKDYDRQVELITLTGENVVDGELIRGNKQLQLNISDVAGGLYFIKVLDGLNSCEFKVMITK
jgi:hypothetical protein